MPHKDSIKAHPNNFRSRIARYESSSIGLLIVATIILWYLASLAVQIDQTKTVSQTNIEAFSQKIVPLILTIVGSWFAVGSIYITLESKKLELFDRSRPSINVYCKDIGNQLIEVVISNVGRGDAEALSVELVPSGFSISPEAEPKGVSLFTLEILATGKEFRQLLPAEITGQLLLKFQSEDGLSHSKIFPVNLANQIREVVLKQLVAKKLFDEKDEYDWGGANPLTIGYPVYHDPRKGLMVFEEDEE